MPQYESLRPLIEAAWHEPERLELPETRQAIETVIEGLDSGHLRCAEPTDESWTVHEWVKQGMLLYFRLRKVEKIESPPFEYFDKIPLKTDFGRLKVRVVPPATCRFGAYLGPEVVMMPSYVNIGAYVDAGTMVDTWATVGTAAQIGKRVHLSGGVGIGGVLEPLQARPVIVEDDAFIGSRCIVVEGVRIGQAAVLGANVVLTASTRILDVTQDPAITHVGEVPPRSVVIPGSMPKTFPGGTFQVPCALIIGQRNAGTDRKTSLNEVLRDYQLAV